VSHHNESCREELLFLLSLPISLTLSLSLFHSLFSIAHSLSSTSLSLSYALGQSKEKKRECVHYRKHTMQIKLFTKQKPTQLTPRLKQAPMTHLYSSVVFCCPFMVVNKPVW